MVRYFFTLALFFIVQHIAVECRSVQDLIDTGEIAKCFIGSSSLDLSKRGLTTLAGLENIMHPESITLIDASSNQLEQVDGILFERFSNISQVYLNNNRLTDISLFVRSGVMRNVCELHCTHNNITTFDFADMVHMPSLYVLNLGFNSITNVVPCYADFRGRLEVLYLNDNHITQLLPQTFSTVPFLQALYLHNNKLKHLDSHCLDGLSSLRVLYLQNNDLRFLPDSIFSDMKSLRCLHMRSNNLERLSDRWNVGLHQLNFLDLSSNHLAPKAYSAHAFSGLKALQYCYVHCQSPTHRLRPDVDLFLSRVRQEVYQDILVEGATIKEGVKDCEIRYANIKNILDQYKRPFTVLDVGASEGYFSLRIAREYDCTAVMIEGDKTLLLPEICKLNTSLDNLVVLEKFVTPEDLKELAACEHFDVVLAFNVVHQMKGAWKEAIDALLTLGDHVLIETPPPGCHTSANKEILPLIEDYLSKQACGSVAGQVPRYGRPGLPGPDQKYSNVYHLRPHKNVLSRPAWGSPHFRFYPLLSTFTEKSIYKVRIDKTTPWVPGINLWTFKHMRGVYPEKDLIRKEIERLSSFVHGDFFPWNMIIQGNRLELIDWDDNTSPDNIHNYQACIDRFEA